MATDVRLITVTGEGYITRKDGTQVPFTITNEVVNGSHASDDDARRNCGCGRYPDRCRCDD